MTQEEIIIYINKFPEVMQSIIELINESAIYLTNVNQFLIDNKLYDKFIEYHTNKIFIKRETIQ